MKTWIATACIIAAGFTACKNDRGNDNQYDTSTVATTPAPYEGQSTSATQPVTDSLLSRDSTSLAYSPNAGTARDDRKPKMSRKGRVILASYRNANNERIAADREGIYNRAEIMPSYPGGETALRRFIEDNIEYPQQAMDNDAQGTVTVYFAVDEQGKIYTPTVISSRIGYGLEEEAMRVVSRMPKWTPGQVRGKNVKTRFTLPITYQIQ